MRAAMAANPLDQGELATCFATLAEPASKEAVTALYAERYADEPFVHVLPPGQWPQTKAVVGSNSVHLQVTVDEAAGRLVAVGDRFRAAAPRLVR